MRADGIDVGMVSTKESKKRDELYIDFTMTWRKSSIHFYSSFFFRLVLSTRVNKLVHINNKCVLTKLQN